VIIKIIHMARSPSDLSYRSALWLRRYLVAGLAVGVMVLVRATLSPLLPGRSPYMLFNMAVMVSAWYGGFGPGLAASFLSAFLAHHFFVPPHSWFTLAQTQDGLAIGLFLIVTISISWLAHLLRSASLRAVEGERRVGEILESIGDNFIALDRDWCFAYINQAAETVLGKRRHELLGKNIWAEYPKLAGSKVGAQYREVYEKQALATFEYFHRAKATWFAVNVYPSKRGGISIYFVDITRRKRHEEEAARLVTLVESSDDAIISATLDGIIQSWNAGAVRLYGYTPDEAIGHSIYMLLPANRADEESQLLERMQRGERVEHFETVRARKDGKLINVSVSISPIRGSRGEVIGVSGIARDVTARIELEEKLRQTQKLESLAVLAGGVAHDFNNLLVPIMGNASLAMESLPPLDRARPMLKEVIQASERASNLTRQLLAYTGRGKFIVELVDLSDLVRETAGLLRASISRKVALQLDLATDLPAVEADATQMQQIVMNRVTTAAEAIGDENGWVRVLTGVEDVDAEFAGATFVHGEIHAGRHVWLEVRDNGCGMDEGTKVRIFDPFFTTKFTGRGLGLSAIAGIVRSHGGMLNVESAPGRGTTMKLWLPATSIRKSKGARELRKELMGRGTILLVDDEDAVRRVAKAALERYGYTVLLAEDGYQAVDTFSRTAEQVLLVILDMAMPGMGGEETFRRLKAIRPEVPVVVCSGFDELETARQFQTGGIAGFLQKPYTVVQLAEKVKAAAAS
jgi:PAS domain S-box-containing protein